MSIKTFFAKHHSSAEKLVEHFHKQGVSIAQGCEIYGTMNLGSEPHTVTHGNHVRVTQGVCFFTYAAEYWGLRYKKGNYYEKFKDADNIRPIVVKDNVHIGINAIIMPCVTIGEISVNGYESVVIYDIPSNSTARGAIQSNRVYRGVCQKGFVERYSNKAHITSGKEAIPHRKVNITEVPRICSSYLGSSWQILMEGTVAV